MHRIVLCALVGAAAFAQTKTPPAGKPPAAPPQAAKPAEVKPAEKPVEPPPPELDQALRSRVNEFYTLLKNQSYRKAEDYVAEDTKDYYYAGVKPEIHAFEMVGIAYTENYTHAKVTVKCTEPVVVAGFPATEITVNIPMMWKIESGSWVVYEDPAKIANPSGLATKVQAAVGQAAAAVSGGPPMMPQMPKEMPKDPSYVLGKVSTDKSEVKLPPGATAQVKIINAAQGPVTLQRGANMHGIDVKLDRAELPGGETAVLTLTAGQNPVEGFFFVRIVPTQEVLSIKVSVK